MDEALQTIYDELGEHLESGEWDEALTSLAELQTLTERKQEKGNG
jgi:hypothetical protein